MGASSRDARPRGRAPPGRRPEAVPRTGPSRGPASAKRPALTPSRDPTTRPPASRLDAAARRRIEEYVKPIAVGLDGVTYFGDVERVVSAAGRLAGSRADLDLDLLFLLAVFSGQEKWVSRMGHASRTEIFLDSLGVQRGQIQALFRGLERLDGDPRTGEEEIVHDAVRIDGMGASGIARSLLEGYRERQDFLEMAEAIEQAAEIPLRTEAGRLLAQERRQTMREFASRLRREHAEFAP